MDIQKEIFRYPLHFLTWTGQDPEQNKIIYFSVGTTYILVNAIEVALLILQFFYTTDVTSIARNIEAVMGFSQILGKCLISALNREGFRKITQGTRKFWRFEMCSKEDQLELENTLKLTLQFEKVFIFMMVSAIGLTVVSSFFLKNLPTGFWVAKDYHMLFTLALVIQQVSLLPMALYIAAYDALFLSLCISLRTQFRLLHCCLRDLDTSAIFCKSDEEIYLKKLTSYVRHHEFLLRFFKDVQKTYSFVMLVVYLTVVLMYCAEMYMVLESKDMFLIIRNLAMMTSALILFSCDCIPLTYITDEAILVSQGIYESNWYSKPVPEASGFIKLIIQRSQQDIIFNAGGLIEMNCQSVLNVVKTSYSVCTILRAVKNV